MLVFIKKAGRGPGTVLGAAGEERGLPEHKATRKSMSPRAQDLRCKSSEVHMQENNQQEHSQHQEQEYHPEGPVGRTYLVPLGYTVPQLFSKEPCDNCSARNWVTQACSSQNLEHLGLGVYNPPPQPLSCRGKTEEMYGLSPTVRPQPQ